MLSYREILDEAAAPPPQKPHYLVVSCDAELAREEWKPNTSSSTQIPRALDEEMKVNSTANMT